MPKGPLIPDPRKRQIVIAILMAGLLVVSLTLAGVITGAKLGF